MMPFDSSSAFLNAPICSFARASIAAARSCARRSIASPRALTVSTAANCPSITCLSLSAARCSLSRAAAAAAPTACNPCCATALALLASASIPPISPARSALNAARRASTSTAGAGATTTGAGATGAGCGAAAAPGATAPPAAAPGGPAKLILIPRCGSGSATKRGSFSGVKGSLLSPLSNLFCARWVCANSPRIFRTLLLFFFFFAKLFFKAGLISVLLNTCWSAARVGATSLLKYP